MLGVHVSYGRPKDPSIRCGRCGKAWLVPQTVRWSDDALQESVEKAMAAGWMIGDYTVRCPDHQEPAEQ